MAIQQRDSTVLRVFCICGQKMRVTENTFGKPGKCVACGQKIRIPRRDEVPADSDEIFLKDHPEFLRKTRKKPADFSGLKRPRERVDEERESTLGLQDERVSTVPIDVLEPLRVLCSLNEQAKRRLKSLESLGNSRTVDADRTELNGHLVRIEESRAELDESLRQRLMETAVELATTQEKLAEADLSVRVGETDYASYKRTAQKLRARRDRLERRQVNLRGWLAVHDPALAGPHDEVSFARIPTAGGKITWPSETNENRPVLDVYMSDLREALLAKDRARIRRDEAARLMESAKASSEGPGQIQRDARGELQRVRVGIDFVRSRIDQYVADCGADEKAVSSQIELLRGRLQVSEIRREQFSSQESALQAERERLRRDMSIAERALIARSAREVPLVSLTMWERMSAVYGEQGFTWDSWLAWAAAGVFVIALLLPAFGGLSAVAAYQQVGGESPWMHWPVTATLGAALSCTILGLIPRRAIRAALLLAVSFIVLLGAVALLQHAWYHPGRIGELMRDGGLAQPGILVFGTGLIAAFAAAAYGLWPYPQPRLAFGAVLAIGLAYAAIVATNFGGSWVPRPVLEHYVAASPGTTGLGSYETRVIVRNEGNRAMYLSEVSEHPYAYSFRLDRRSGQQWDVVAPNSSDAPETAARGGRELEPGADATFIYSVGGGDYRASLQPMGGSEPVAHAFTLEEILPEPAVETETSSADTETLEELEESSQGPRADTETVIVALTGTIAMGPDSAPRFLIDLTLPDGSLLSERYQLGDIIYGDWVVREYNSGLGTVTLASDDDIRIVRSGEPLEIDVEVRPDVDPLPGGDAARARAIAPAPPPPPVETFAPPTPDAVLTPPARTLPPPNGRAATGQFPQ